MTRRARPHPLDEQTPFHANRTLGYLTRFRVWVRAIFRPSTRDDLAFCRLLSAEIPIADSPQPSEAEWSEVWDRIVPQISPIRQIGSSGLAGRRGRIAPIPARAKRTPSWPRPSGASWSVAAALALAVVGGGIALNGGSPFPSRDSASANDGGYHLAGGPREILVQFRADATAEQIRDLLAGLQLRVIDGPSARGVYQLRLTDPDAGSAAIDRAVASLRADEIVSRADAR